MLSENEVRREKLAALEAAGIKPYPAVSHRTALCEDAQSHFEEWAEAKREITLAGRLLTTRVHGAIIFADLADASGKIQILVKQDAVGEELFVRFRDRIDPADIVEATGTLFVTQRGERTLAVSTWRLLSKALLPLPEKWHGLSDQETRYRFRELDLIANADVRQSFMTRSKCISAFRRALEDEGFMEVETPVLQVIPGGASARPFVTHHNALDIDMYLRIAPELYLKRLVVGGFEKVFEIGRQFRNEGIDWSHNPEFTSLEFYWAYQDYHGLMDFTEKLVTRVMKEVVGTTVITFGEQTLDFTTPWPRVKFRDAIREACGIDIGTLSREELVGEMKRLKIDVDYETSNLGKLYDELYKDVVRAKNVQPMFVIDYPIEMEPLAKKCDDDPRYVQRFQLLAGGLELLKAYSELNDPIDQLHRFREQQALREEGDDEAQQIDQAFITSLEHGLPPTAGWGMGIDRFVALLANANSIKDIILFPTMKPERS